MFNGLEVDVIALGDADCIVVTKWQESVPHRILIDGGSGSDAEVILDFLRRRNSTHFWAVICTHLHNDHANGLIKLVRSNTITFTHGLMHDITKHTSAQALRRATASNDGVQEVVETTKELAAAFTSRGITPIEPFTGMGIAKWPEMTVLGPSLPFYNRILEEFTEAGSTLKMTPMWSAFAALAGTPARTGLSGLAELALASSPAPPYAGFTSPIPPSPVFGVLSESRVKESPTTQPYNNTSVILGVKLNENKLLFTGDAGSEALSHVSSDWGRLLYMGVPHHGSDGNLSQSDIERFCPQFATISAKGDSSHPSRAIVSGLVKVGTKVGSTHKSGNLWFWSGSVPARTDYEACEYLKGTGSPEPVVDWAKILSGLK
jgi:beta-lactamase superfamily II metal-dependent hydrolase